MTEARTPTQEQREQIERLCAVQALHLTATNLRALKLTLAGLYHAAPRGSDIEKDAGAAYQHVCDVLALVEGRTVAFPSETEVKQQADEMAEALGMPTDQALQPIRIH